MSIRRRHPAPGDGTLLWLPRPAGANGGGGGAGGGVLLFVLEPGFVCAVNVSGPPAPLPDGAILLASGPLTEGGDLPAEIAVWLAVPPSTA